MHTSKKHSSDVKPHLTSSEVYEWALSSCLKKNNTIKKNANSNEINNQYVRTCVMDDTKENYL